MAHRTARLNGFGRQLLIDRVIVGGWTVATASAAQLCVALMLAIVRTDGLAVCSACGTPYAPARRPAIARRRYCPPCRDSKAPKRDASRDWNQRNPDYYREHRARRRA